MDCHVPVDDECFVESAEAPENIPFSDDRDRFYLKFMVTKMTLPDLDSDDEEEDYFERSLEEAVVHSTSTVFWAPCRRNRERDSLAKDGVRRMLTEAGVPRCKVDYLSDIVAAEADAIAMESLEKKVVGVAVRINMFACACSGEEVRDGTSILNGEIHHGEIHQVYGTKVDSDYWMEIDE